MILTHNNLAFVNISGNSPIYTEKATAALRLLSSHTAITAYLNGRQCNIRLAKRLAATPADITDNGPAGVVDVVLAAYYFESYSVGYVAGMLCHEFAVHHVADSLGATAADNAMHFPLLVPGVAGITINPATAAEADHIYCVAPTARRADIYRDAALEMADLLHTEAQAQGSGVQGQDVTDLLDCYLMDVASIAVTNDHRLQGLPYTPNSAPVRQNIAAVYQAYKLLLQNQAQAAYPAIVPSFPPDKTAADVEQDYLTLAKRAAVGLFGAPSIG